MNLELSQDQNQIRDAVASWLTSEYPLARRQQIISKGGFSRDVFRELGELGFTALTISTDYGGLGLGHVERMILMEELCKGVVLEPLAQTFICSALLSKYGGEAMVAGLLPSIATAKTLPTFAHTESARRDDNAQCATTAAASNQGNYTLTGGKTLVPSGDQADLYIVSATFEGDVALFVVKKDAPGTRMNAYQTQDGSRAGELGLNQTPGVLLTPMGNEAIKYATALAAQCACAEAVGVMQTALQATVEYMNTRTQFGAPLSRFQALRHQVADMKLHLELARSMCFYATMALDSESPERDQAIARAMYQLSQSMRFVGQHAVQLHGGIGMTDEYIVSHCFRRLTQLELLHGGSLHHLAIVSELMDEAAGVIS